MKYLKEFQNHAEYEVFTASTEFIKPNLSICNQESDVHYNPYIPPTPPTPFDYLTFIAEEGGQFTFTSKASAGDIQYSKNGGEWVTDTAVTVNSGDKVLWKGEMTPSTNGIGTFSSTGRFSVGGNSMSLLYGDNFVGQTSLTGKDYAFYTLFSGCTELTSIDYLVLPATTLETVCYGYMFYNCSGLTSIPNGFLLATTLASACYVGMFQRCFALTSVPNDLLPATTLATNCYNAMFQSCSLLETAPDLPAPTLVNNCYNMMFRSCAHLNYIKCLATDISAPSCTSNWVEYVQTNSGTFVKPASVNWTSGNSGIPNGWTVQDA